MSVGNGAPHPVASSSGFTELLKEVIREAVVEALRGSRPASAQELLEPHELAAKLKVPISWV